MVQLKRWKEQDLRPGAPRPREEREPRVPIPREERESQGLGPQVNALAQAEDREGGIGKQVSALAHARNDARKLERGQEPRPDKDLVNPPGLGRDLQEQARDMNAAIKTFIENNDAHWQAAMENKAGPKEFAQIGKDIMDLINPARLAGAATKIGMDTLFPPVGSNDQERPKANKAIAKAYDGSFVERIVERLGK